MALNRWMSAALLVSVLGFAGCTQPQPKNPDAQPTAAATTAAPAQTPAEQAGTATPAATATATPSGTATPSDSAATPAAGGETAAAAGGGDKAAMLEDLENADGMKGYDEVKAMEPVAGDAAKGKELFAANCASCHGAEGHGDGPAGASLDPKPRNLTATSEYKFGHMAMAVYRTGMYGVEGTGMAPWDGIIEPKDMWDIVAYVETLQK